MQDITYSKALSIFGIKNNYTEDELKKKYRELVKKNHPDYHANTTPEKQEEYNRKTQDINEAYDVLKKNLNKGTTYTYQNASTYWSHQSYQGYGYYRQREAELIFEMKEIKKKISSYFKPCPAEKLKEQVSNLILDYIMKVGHSPNTNLTFINFKIDLENIYRNYIDTYFQKYKIPEFLIYVYKFNYDCDCSKLFKQIKDCEQRIEYDFSKIIKKFKYHDYFKTLEMKILEEKNKIRKKINYYTTNKEYLNILKEYENIVDKMIIEYNRKYCEFKYALDKLSNQLDKKVKKYLYDNIKELILKLNDDEITELLIEAIKESKLQKNMETIDKIKESFSKKTSESEKTKKLRTRNTRETIYNELKKKYLNSNPSVDIVNKLFIKAVTLLYSENCSMKIVQEINNLTFENPQEEYQKLSIYDNIGNYELNEIKQESSYRL